MKFVYTNLLFFLSVTYSYSQIAYQQTASNPQMSLEFTGVFDGTVDFSDVDGDGDDDVMITGNSGLGLLAKIYKNDGTGVFTEDLVNSFDGIMQGSIAFADVDNDNDEDLLITGQTASNRIAKLYLNDGVGNFSLVPGNMFIGVGESSAEFADVDGDNDLDVLITGKNNLTHVSILYTNDGMGNFSQVSGTSFEDVSRSAISFSDIDNDSDQDVLITGWNGSVRISKLYKNDGLGNYTEDVTASFQPVEFGTVDFSDVDDDGDKDVLITGLNSARLYTNDGVGNFNYVSATPFFSTSNSGVAFSDMDGDGDEDVLITGNSISGPNAKVYENNAGTFTEVTSVSFTGIMNNAVAFSDIDGNSSPDLVITGYNGTLGNIAQLYKHTSCFPTSSVDIQTICAASYLWIDGNTYTSDNTTATHTISGGNSAGCDSIVTLNLTFDSVNISTSISGNTLMANESGLSYQWIDCADNSNISGENAQSFIATSIGNYAVVVSNGNCTDTSGCIAINSIDIIELEVSEMTVYPNPNAGTFTVEIPNECPIEKVIVRDMQARIVDVKIENDENGNLALALNESRSGVYQLMIICDDSVIYRTRVVVE